MTNLSSQTYAYAYRAGETKRKAGQYEEARKDFGDALARAVTGPERADALLGIGITYADWAQAHQYHVWTPPASHLGKYYFERLRQLEAARTGFEKVLAIPDITPDQKAQAHYHLAMVYYGLEQYARAQEELQKIAEMKGVSAGWLVKTQMLVGHYTRYGGKGDPIASYTKALDIPGISPAQSAEAHLAVVSILLEKRQSADAHLGVVGAILEKHNRTDAHLELAKVFKIADLPPASRALAQLVLGKIFFLEANYAAARDALEKALRTKELPDTDKVEAQLNIGLSDYYEGKDYERAGRELRKVMEMPGASYVQIHDATLRLRLKKMLPGDEKFVTALFTGSSHTQVRNVPQIVELLSASAPAGRPRIIASQATFGGHTPMKLWDLGDGPGTPRARIASDPWDYLVIENYGVGGNTSAVGYVERFVNLARAENIRPILYETPVSARLPYPDSFMKSHDESVAIAKQLEIQLASAAYAWMLYLGPNPSTEERLSLYHPDGGHTAKKGAYMVACCIYSAITGFSPVGLAHDMACLAWTDCTGELSEEEALALQKAAWKSVREANPGLKCLP